MSQKNQKTTYLGKDKMEEVNDSMSNVTLSVMLCQELLAALER
jgi:hypothetical protein